MKYGNFNKKKFLKLDKIEVKSEAFLEISDDSDISLAAPYCDTFYLSNGEQIIGKLAGEDNNRVHYKECSEGAELLFTIKKEKLEKIVLFDGRVIKKFDQIIIPLREPKDTLNCDYIYPLNGSRISCKINEANDQSIQYSTCPSDENIEYTIPVSSVKRIEYATGHHKDYEESGTSRVVDPELNAKNDRYWRRMLLGYFGAAGLGIIGLFAFGSSYALGMVFLGVGVLVYIYGIISAILLRSSFANTPKEKKSKRDYNRQWLVWEMFVRGVLVGFLGVIALLS